MLVTLIDSNNNCYKAIPKMSHHLIEFLQKVTVIDTETTGLDVNTVEIVELSGLRFDNTGNWIAKDQLFGTYEPIPFEASAIHHISNRMVENKLKFDQAIDAVLEILNLEDTDYFVAHNVEYDKPIILNHFKKSKRFDLISEYADNNRWICTLRLAKKLIESPYYKLNYLRYSLDLDVKDGDMAHRATTDSFACASLLERLVILALDSGKISNDLPIGPQLNELCWAPFQYSTWPIPGKHLGHKLTEIPTDYYAWCFEKLDSFQENNSRYDPDLLNSVAAILNERLK